MNKPGLILLHSFDRLNVDMPKRLTCCPLNVNLGPCGIMISQVLKRLKLNFTYLFKYIKIFPCLEMRNWKFVYLKGLKLVFYIFIGIEILLFIFLIFLK